MPIYMKIDGIKGQVSTKGYEESIALESAQFGASRNLGTFTGTSREVGTPNISEIVVTKMLDSASTALFRNSLLGDPFPMVELFFTRDKGGGEQEAYLKITLEQVLITSYSLSGSSGVDAPMESLSLNFLTVEYAATWRGGDYGAGGEDEFGYDMSTMSSL
jgi:type VI secretion system secreted protein Hcp